MKSILVLEGGALRAIYTAGVIDTLLENKIEVDAVVGVSAGALFGINYLSKQKGRVLRYNLANLKNKEYMGFYSYLKTGNVMNKEFCFDTLVRKTDPFDFKTFHKSKIDFYAVLTNLKSGKPEYKKIKDLEKEEEMEYLRASGSMPILSKIVKVGNDEYLDGGISDSIPVEWAKKQGYDKIIVVETRRKEYRKKEKSILPFKICYQKYPNFLEAVKNRPKMYNKIKEQNCKEDRKKIFVIRPTKKIEVKHIERDKEKLISMYNLGVEDTKNCLEELITYLKDCKE